MTDIELPNTELEIRELQRRRSQLSERRDSQSSGVSSIYEERRDGGRKPSVLQERGGNGVSGSVNNERSNRKPSEANVSRSDAEQKKENKIVRSRRGTNATKRDSQVSRRESHVTAVARKDSKVTVASRRGSQVAGPRKDSHVTADRTASQITAVSRKERQVPVSRRSSQVHIDRKNSQAATEQRGGKTSREGSETSSLKKETQPRTQGESFARRDIEVNELKILEADKKSSESRVRYEQFLDQRFLGKYYVERKQDSGDSGISSDGSLVDGKKLTCPHCKKRISWEDLNTHKCAKDNCPFVGTDDEIANHYAWDHREELFRAAPFFLNERIKCAVCNVVVPVDEYLIHLCRLHEESVFVASNGRFNLPKGPKMNEFLLEDIRRSMEQVERCVSFEQKTPSVKIPTPKPESKKSEKPKPPTPKEPTPKPESVKSILKAPSTKESTKISESTKRSESTKSSSEQEESEPTRSGYTPSDSDSSRLYLSSGDTSGTTTTTALSFDFIPTPSDTGLSYHDVVKETERKSRSRSERKSRRTSSRKPETTEDKETEECSRSSGSGVTISTSGTTTTTCLSWDWDDWGPDSSDENKPNSG